MTRSALALRVAVLTLALVWWLPTIVVMFGHLAWRGVRLRRGLARVQKLRRAEQLDDAQAALDRLWRITCDGG